METPSGTLSRKETTVTAISHRSLLYALVIAAGLATNPFVNMGFSDDWAYSQIAVRFAQTGHIEYGKWAAAAVLVQTVYGALLTKLFGGTFVTHRLGTLFVAGFIPVLVYETGRRLKLNGRMALFGALTVGLSPLFTPHAVSFMSDPYGCLFALAAIYAGIRSVQAERGSTAIAWFGAGMFLAFVGGMNRQVVWVAGPAIFAAYCLSRHRQARRQLVASAALTAAYVLGCCCVMAWLKKQPGFEYKALDAATLTFLGAHTFRTAWLYGKLVLTLLVLAIPALAAGVRARRTDARANAVGFSGGLLVLLLGYWKIGLVFPFLSNVLTRYGLFSEGELLPGGQPVVLPMWVCRLAAALACGLALKLLAQWVPVFRQAAGRIRRAILSADSAENATILSTLLPCAFMLLYLFALAFLIARGMILDRYALMLLPFLVFMIMWAWQRGGAEKPGVGAYALLIVFSGYGTAITHDHFALSKAQLKAVDAFEARGVARNLFLAGFEYDMSSQLPEQRHFLGPWGLPETAAAYPSVWYLPMVPAIKPVYFVSTSNLPRMSSCGFQPVPYLTWLPPRHRELVVLCRGGQKP